MRLIDVDEIGLQIPNEENEDFGRGVKFALSKVNKFPTVFDVEKVMEQLEKQQNINRYVHHNDEWNVGIEQAIEIVRGGGVNE